MEPKLKTTTQVGTVVYTYEYRGYTFYTWRLEPQPAPVINGKFTWNLLFKDTAPEHVSKTIKTTGLYTRAVAITTAMQFIDLWYAYDESIRESVEATNATPSK